MIFKSFKPFLSGRLTLTLLHIQNKGRFILSTAVYEVSLAKLEPEILVIKIEPLKKNVLYAK